MIKHITALTLLIQLSCAITGLRDDLKAAPKYFDNSHLFEKYIEGRMVSANLKIIYSFHGSRTIT